MANDFTTDINCVALWRMESASLTTDSIGTNTLTNVGTTAATASGQYKEGSCAADFESLDNDYMYINDSDLDADFPLKNGDTTKKFSIAFWAKPESTGKDRCVVSKYDSVNNKRSLAIRFDYSAIQILNGYNNGESAESWNSDSKIYAGRWYHIGVVHDGVNKTTTVRLYDEYYGESTTYTLTWNNETNVEDSPFVLGTTGNFDSTYDYDGILDEVAVFKDLLSVDDIDQIKNNTYDLSTGIRKVSNVISEVEYLTSDTGQKVSNIVTEVEYKISTGFTGTVTTGIDAVLQKTITETSNLGAYLLGTNEKITSFDAHLQTSKTINTNIDADLTLVETISFNAYLQKTITTTTSIDAKLQKFNFIHASLDALTQRPPEEITNNLSALLKIEGAQATLTMDALLQEAGLVAGGSVDANLASSKATISSIDANLAQGALTTTGNIDAVLQKKFDSVANIHAIILDPYSKIDAMDALLQKPNLTKTTNIDSYLQIVESSGASLDANLVISTPKTISLDAYLKQDIVSVTGGMDALLLPPPSDVSGGMFLIF